MVCNSTFRQKCHSMPRCRKRLSLPQWCEIVHSDRKNPLVTIWSNVVVYAVHSE